MKQNYLREWEKSCDDVRNAIPKCCYTCGHRAPGEPDEVYCRRFSQEPPSEFAEKRDQCDEWVSVLDGVPF